MSMNDKGQIQRGVKDRNASNHARNELFVLDTSIFSNVFKKDIKRVYLYKKTERLAKVIHLISPAFNQTPSLKHRIELLSIALIDAAIVAPSEAREMLSKELLALSSFLSVARASGLLSHMNVDLITKETNILLSEVAEYEEPRFSFEDTQSLAELLNESEKHRFTVASDQKKQVHSPLVIQNITALQRNKKTEGISKRQEAILSIIKDKGEVYIKDISTMLRDYSEKTIQRELSTLVLSGVLEKKGDKRWTTYNLLRN